LYAVMGLGAFAIILGMVAIIASNWHSISGGFKITVDLLFCALLAAAALKPEGKGGGLIRETAIILLFGMTLASIGLISQVYHLSGKPYQGLLVWLFLVTPLVFHGRGGFL